MAAPIRYAIADDHSIFIRGLRVVLADDPKLTCTGEALDGSQLLSLLHDVDTDVVLLDINMPNMDGIEVLKELRQRQSHVKVVILTMSDDEQYITKLIELGANGYLIKNAEPAEVKTALHTVVESGFYFNDYVNKAMLKKLVTKNNIKPRFKTNIKLTDIDIEVLLLICKEHTNAEIAAKLFKSPRTIEGIRSALLEKIGVRNTAGLVIYAVKNGIYED